MKKQRGSLHGLAAILLTGFLVVFLSSCAMSPKREHKVLSRWSQEIGGSPYVPLAWVCSVHKIRYRWDPVSRKNLLSKGDSFLIFRVNQPRVVVNGETVGLKSPPRMVAGQVMIPLEMALFHWWDRGRTRRKPAPLASHTGLNQVIIDPGHGGHDKGAVNGFGLREKDLVLDIAKKLRDELKSRGFEVLMTRESDDYLTLTERVYLANISRADFFLSIHANSAPHGSARGIEIYHSPTASGLAEHILGAIERDSSIKTRGRRVADFRVLKWAEMPSVLIELGFLTNFDEARELVRPSYQDHLVQLIAEGLLTYKMEYEQQQRLSGQ